jgi:hypothetical protein
MVFLAVVGAANSVEDVALITLLQRTAPNEFLARVLGTMWGLAMGAVAVGSIAATAVVDVVGTRLAFVVVGLILPLLTFMSYRRLVEIDRTAAAGQALELIDAVPMFAPLSIAMKERLAATVVPVSVTAGDVVIRAGDVGDRLYIVGDGAPRHRRSDPPHRRPGRRLLRSDRAATRGCADRDGQGDRRLAAVHTPTRCLSHRRHGLSVRTGGRSRRRGSTSRARATRDAGSLSGR